MNVVQGGGHLNLPVHCIRAPIDQLDPYVLDLSDKCGDLFQCIYHMDDEETGSDYCGSDPCICVCTFNFNTTR